MNVNLSLNFNQILDLVKQLPKNQKEKLTQELINDKEISEDYKIMMDDMLGKHTKGQLNYTSWEKVKRELPS